MKKPTSVWIYKNETGEIYRVAAIIQDKKTGEMTVSEYPVKSTRQKVIERQMRDIFGRCEFTTVSILPDAREC